MAIQTKVKKWGNSIGIIIPAEVIRGLNLNPDEEVIIEIEKKGNILKEMFGTMKSNKTARQILDESRKELESKWM